MFGIGTTSLVDQLMVPEERPATVKRADEFTSVENGVGSGSTLVVASANAATGDPHRLSRQVSLRVRRKTIVRKAAAQDTWREAADKVRVRHDATSMRMLRTTLTFFEYEL